MTKPMNVRLGENQLFDISPGKSWPLGTRAFTTSGRVFKYARASAIAIAVGRLVRRPEESLGMSNLTVASAVSAGGTEITLTMTHGRTTLDEYAEGLFYINDAAGEGHVHEIVGNDAVSPTNTLTVDINAPIKVALSTSSQVTLIKSRWNGVRATELGPNERALGATPIAVTASYYFWAQVAGPCALLQDGEWDENKDLVPSTYVRGTTMVASSVSQGAEARLSDVILDDRLASGNVAPGTAVTNMIGYALDPRADTEYGLVHLNLDR